MFCNNKNNCHLWNKIMISNNFFLYSSKFLKFTNNCVIFCGDFKSHFCWFLSVLHMRLRYIWVIEMWSFQWHFVLKGQVLLLDLYFSLYPCYIFENIPWKLCKYYVSKRPMIFKLSCLVLLWSIMIHNIQFDWWRFIHVCCYLFFKRFLYLIRNFNWLTFSGVPSLKTNSSFRYWYKRLCIMSFRTLVKIRKADIGL